MEASIIERVVDRIVETAQPLRIILFGSQARGNARPDSDVDLLILMPDGTHPRRAAADLYAALVGIPVAVDLIVNTPAMLERQRHNRDLIYHEALDTGKVIYAHASAA